MNSGLLLTLLSLSWMQNVAPPSAPEGGDTEATKQAVTSDATKDVDASPYPRFVEDETIKGTVKCVGSSSVGLILNAVRPGFREAQKRSNSSLRVPARLRHRKHLLREQRTSRL